MRGFRLLLAGCGAGALAAMCGVASAQMQGGAGQQGGAMGQQQQQQQGAATNPNATGQPGMDNMGQPGGLSMQDTAFLHEAGEGGVFEVQAGQLAQQKGQSDAVKQFGAMMVKDHTALDNALMPFMKQASEKPPTRLGGKEKKEYEKLEGLNGAAFDTAYVQMMVKDHQHDLDTFKEEAMTTQSPALRATVQQGEQVISMHLDKIKQISSSMGTTAGM